MTVLSFPVAACSPHVYLADPSANAEEILCIAKEATKAGAHLLVFPELALTGATCADLFFQPLLINAAKKELLKLARKTKALKTILIVGLPLEIEERLYNVAAVLKDGEVKGIVPKVYFETRIPGKFHGSPEEENLFPACSSFFHELRWFSDGTQLKTRISLAEKSVPVDPAFVLNNLFTCGGADSASRAFLPRKLWVVVGNIFFLKAAANQRNAKGLLGNAGLQGTRGAGILKDAKAFKGTKALKNAEAPKNVKAFQGATALKNVGALKGTKSLKDRGLLDDSFIIANPTATPAIAAPVTLEKKVQDFIEVNDLCLARAGAGEGESTTDFVLNGVCYLKGKGDDPLVFSETGWCMGGDAIDINRGASSDKKNLAGKDAGAKKSANIKGDADTRRYNRYACAQNHAGAKKFTNAHLSQGLLTKGPRVTRADLAEPFLTADKERAAAICDQAFSIQARGLKQRLEATGIQKLVVGVSGGLDSTLALLVSARVLKELDLPKKNLLAISMPGFGTTKTTQRNAELLVHELGATYKEISIVNAVEQHFKDIGHRIGNRNSAFENAQARERTQILMDVANDEAALVVGTGDMSEAALGWATYNGDHMSMYNVNGGVPKTMVRAIVKNIALERSVGTGTAHDASGSAITANSTKSKYESDGEYATENERTLNVENGARASLSEVLLAIVDTPISPELLPPKKGKIQQKTEDMVGPYELHDFFLYHFVHDRMAPKEIFRLARKAFPKTAPKTIAKWEKVFFSRFFAQQFKRNCSVDGPQVTEISLSPRAGLEMPSDVTASLWLKEASSLR